MADLCVTGFVDPMSIAGVVLGPKYFLERETLCHIIGSICLASCVCSLWTISTISINRFVLICHNRHYSSIFTWNRCIAYCLALWILAWLLDIPNYLNWGDHSYDMKTMACSYDRLASYSYTAFFITVFVAFPLATVSYCNVNIYLKVKNSKMKVAANAQSSKSGRVTSVNTVSKHISSVDDPSIMKVDEEGTTMIGNAEYNDSAGPSQVLRSKVRQGDLKLAKTLFVVFLVFLVCWAPYASLCLFDPGDLVSKEFYIIAIKLAHTNSSLNSILYAAMNKNFLEGYKLFLRKVFLCLPKK